MATTVQKIQEHDVVRLKHAVEDSPSGEEGTVLAVKDHWKLVELADERGVTLDLLSVRDEDLDLIWKPGWPDLPDSRSYFLLSARHACAAPS